MGRVVEGRESGSAEEGGNAESGGVEEGDKRERSGGAVFDDGAVQRDSARGGRGVRGVEGGVVWRRGSGGEVGERSAGEGKTREAVARIRADGEHDVCDVGRGEGGGRESEEHPDRSGVV